MSKLRDQVTAFHQAFGVPVLDRPQVPSEERVRLRLRLVAEEFLELMGACIKAPATIEWLDDQLNELIEKSKVRVMLPEAADALGDLDYVIEGTRLEFGIDGGPIADEIQRSNLAKVGGPVLPGGKIGKPADWTPPDIAGELKKQGWEG